MKKYFIILGVIQLITAAGAIPSGLLFILDPSGAGMGNSTDMLSGSPFKSFLIPGLFLLIINGLGNTGGAVLSFMKRAAAGPVAIVLGVILGLWIIIQVMIIGLSSFLQPVFFLVGIAEILIGYTIASTKSFKKE